MQYWRQIIKVVRFLCIPVFVLLDKNRRIPLPSNGFLELLSQYNKMLAENILKCVQDVSVNTP